MRHDDDCLIGHVAQVLKDMLFGGAVERRGRLVQEQDGTVAEHGPCDRKALHLPLRETCPPLTEERVDSRI